MQNILFPFKIIISFVAGSLLYYTFLNSVDMNGLNLWPMLNSGLFIIIFTLTAGGISFIKNSHYLIKATHIIVLVGFVISANHSAGLYGYKWIPLWMPLAAFILSGQLAHSWFQVRSRTQDYNNLKPRRIISSSIALTTVAILMIFLTLSSERYKYRAYNSDTKANLTNLLLTCMDYWRDQGGSKDCTLDIATSTTYGFNNSPNVQILINGNQNNFIAYAYHEKRPDVFEIDFSGNIIKSTYHPFRVQSIPQNKLERFIKNISRKTT